MLICPLIVVISIWVDMATVRVILKGFVSTEAKDKKLFNLVPKAFG